MGVQGRNREKTGKGLLLMGCGPAGFECRRGDGDAAGMADDGLLPPLIADEAGAAGTAEQGRQGHAREFGDSRFHAFFLPGDALGRVIPLRTTGFSQSNGYNGLA